MTCPPPGQTDLSRRRNYQRRLQLAREWGERMKPGFDAMDRAGVFSDSWRRHPELLYGVSAAR